MLALSYNSMKIQAAIILHVSTIDMQVFISHPTSMELRGGIHIPGAPSTNTA